jgi:hypothetical protein
MKVQRSSLFVLFCLTRHVRSEYDVFRTYSRAWSLGHVKLQASTALCAISLGDLPIFDAKGTIPGRKAPSEICPIAGSKCIQTPSL